MKLSAGRAGGGGDGGGGEEAMAPKWAPACGPWSYAGPSRSLPAPSGEASRTNWTLASH